MDIKITYPPARGNRGFWGVVLLLLRWLTVAAFLICPVVNFATGGKAWSIIAMMGIYMLWTLVLSPDLVEYNRISQFIKLVLCSCVLLGLIDHFLAPGWALSVVPMVVLGAMAVCAGLFFSDLERQKQNMMPMLGLIVLALVGCVIGLCLWGFKCPWPILAMGALALVLLIGSWIIMGRDFTRELKRRFHTQ